VSGLQTLPVERAVRSDPLTPTDRRQLEVESAIARDVIAEEDIRSLPSSLHLPKPDPALRHPNSNKGQRFGQWGETDDQGRPIDLGPGIWFGTQDVAGRLSGQYKPAAPRTAFNGHVVKYEGCRGTRPSFAVPRRCLQALVETMAETFFTEGYKKALALASAGACAISLAGVDSWSVKPAPNEPSEPVEDFDAVRWHGRLVWICYDSDAVLKGGVKWAERRLTKELEARGAVVVVVRVPHAADGSKRGVDDFIRDRLAAGVSRADAIHELKACAVAELAGRLAAKRPAPPPGPGGEQTCRDCEPLREQLREYRAALELIRRGPLPAGEMSVVRQLAIVAAGLRSRGAKRQALLRQDLAELSGASLKTVTRAFVQLRRWQTDPDLRLPFQLATRFEGGREHVDLILPERESSERASLADDFRALARLPRPVERPPHGGYRCAAHPDARVIRTTVWRCSEPDCGRVLGQAVASFGGHPLPGHDGPEEDVNYYYPGQDGPEEVPDPGHDGPEETPLIPVSFVSRDDLAWADEPHYLAEHSPDDPPVWQPPPIAPPEHVSWWSRPPTISGGAE